MENSQKLSFFLALVLLVVLENNNCTGCYVYIESPIVTSYGSWSDLNVCPGSGLFVTGMQLKSQPIEDGQDNTALNGVAFTCASPMCEDQETFDIGMAAQWGTWGSQFVCPNYGYVVGFQMRSQVEQGASGDNTAANNLRIVCNDGSGKLTVYEGDGETLGDWTTPQLCPQGMAVTGTWGKVENGEG